MIKELYQYREFLKTNVKKDIRGKYTFFIISELAIIQNVPCEITVVNQFQGSIAITINVT